MSSGIMRDLDALQEEATLRGYPRDIQTQANFLVKSNPILRVASAAKTPTTYRTIVKTQCTHFLKLAIRAMRLAGFGYEEIQAMWDLDLGAVIVECEEGILSYRKGGVNDPGLSGQDGFL